MGELGLQCRGGCCQEILCSDTPANANSDAPQKIWEEPSMDQYQCRGNFRRTFRTIGPNKFPQEKVWTNGAQSSLKVSVLTGIGP